MSYVGTEADSLANAKRGKTLALGTKVPTKLFVSV